MFAFLQKQIDFNDTGVDERMAIELLSRANCIRAYLKNYFELSARGLARIEFKDPLKLSLELGQVHRLGRDAPASTLFYKDGRSKVLVDQSLPLGVLVVFLAHELVHVAQGPSHSLETEIRNEYKAYQIQLVFTEELIKRVRGFRTFMKHQDVISLDSLISLSIGQIRKRYLYRTR